MVIAPEEGFAQVLSDSSQYYELDPPAVCVLAMLNTMC